MRKEPLTTALYKREIKHSPSKKQTAPHQLYVRTFHPLMQFLKNDVFDDFIGCLIV